MLAAASLTSCDLTTETHSSFDESVVFSNYTLAEYNIFSIYEVFTHQNSHRGRYLPYYGFNTDIEWYNSTGNSSQKGDLARYSTATNNEQLNLSNGPYNELYVGIERANVCIKALRQYGDIENDRDMAFLLGEALTMRAVLYTELLKGWGEVPARFEPIQPETMYINKADRDVIYKQLLADLEESFDYLCWPGQNSATMHTDRVSLALAKGLYARLALMASGYSLRPDKGQVGTGNPGSIRLTDDKDLSKEALYPKALAALKDVINNSGLDLEPDYETLWRDFNNMDITAGKEVIWVIPFGDGRGRWNFTFAVAAGKYSAPNQGGSARGGSAGPVPTLFWKYGVNDVRRDISCANFEWEDNAVRPVPSGADTWYFGKYRFDWMTTHPYGGGQDDGIKPVWMRYSDILLMAAEIANDPACGDRDEDFAKAQLLKVRKRAYAGNESEAEAYVNGLSGQAEIFDAIVDERALEFVGEFLRKADLIRWNMLKEKLDEAKADMRKLASRGAGYNDFGPYLYYRYKEDGVTLETYGLEHGQITTADVTPEGEGWLPYTDSKGAVTMYISESAIDEDKINSMYDEGVNPDMRQWWPIFDATLVNAQGSLVNDYGY